MQVARCLNLARQKKNQTVKIYLQSIFIYYACFCYCMININLLLLSLTYSAARGIVSSGSARQSDRRLSCESHMDDIITYISTVFIQISL